MQTHRGAGEWNKFHSPTPLSNKAKKIQTGILSVYANPDCKKKATEKIANTADNLRSDNR